MSSLKKMTGTTSFKQLPKYQRKCLAHTREKCQTQKYLDQVQAQCRCVPWTLKSHYSKIFLTKQDSIYCGPAMETCVVNQTLKDRSCLVPCEGLYAYIEDGSLKENVMTSFKAISQQWGNKYVDAALQQVFPDSFTDEETDHVTRLTEIYHKYKSKYVQHLSFSPSEKPGK